MKTLGSVSAVIAAIDDEVAIDVERLEEATAATLARVQETSDRTPHDASDRDRRLAFARARAHERLSREDYLDRRAELEAREAWLRKVTTAGRAQLSAVGRAHAVSWLAALADEALAAIPALDCVLLVRDFDRSMLDQHWVAARTTAAAKRSVVLQAAEIDGGCIATSEDGRVRFDNSVAARIERCESTWRRVLATHFEEACR